MNSSHIYTAGARTRNVVNIADPGGTTAAHAITNFSTIAAPTGDSAGFKNFHSQKNLHIVIKNNGLDDGGSTAVAVVPPVNEVATAILSTPSIGIITLEFVLLAVDITTFLNSRASALPTETGIFNGAHSLLRMKGTTASGLV